MDWIKILEIVVPALVTLFLRSPLSQHVPKIVIDTVADLPPDTVSQIVEKVGSKEARTDTAISLIKDICLRNGIVVSDSTAKGIVTWAGNKYKSIAK
jgi:ABC-type siderophore export system fused ATPase/permease subunit